MGFALIPRNQPRAELRSSRVNKKRQLQDMHEMICRLVAPVLKILTTPQFYWLLNHGPRVPSGETAMHVFCNE